MAVNQRVEILTDDKESQLQDAPAQASRSIFTPGKPTPTIVNSDVRGQANWPFEFTVKVGNPLFDNNGGVMHDRVNLIDRNTVCDKTIPAPIVLGTTTESVLYYGSWGGSHVRTNTQYIPNDGKNERDTGWDGKKS